MEKYTIAIEEIRVKEFEILAKDAEDAMNIAEDQYNKGLLIVSKEEPIFKQMAIVEPEDEETEWTEF